MNKEITIEMLREAKQKLEELEEKRIIPICMGRYRFEVSQENLDDFLELFKKDKNLIKKLDKYFAQQENKKLTEDFFEFERLEYLNNLNINSLLNNDEKWVWIIANL